MNEGDDPPASGEPDGGTASESAVRDGGATSEPDVGDGGTTTAPSSPGGGTATTTEEALPAGLARPLSTAERLLPGRTRATRAVVAIALAALVLRLWALGWRVMHWDEARVAYWVLRSVETGEWHYRYIIHGPLVQHVDRLLFATFGPGDAVARLPVALVGGLLPLSALLFREHLDDGELVALAGLFAIDPILLYYSRFMRSDLLVAAFMVASLGFLVRLYDTRRPVHLYLAGGFAALGFASKENAVVYALCWVGMVATMAGLELVLPRRHDGRDAVLAHWRGRAEAWADWAAGPASRRWGAHLLGAVLLFGVLTVLFYAPRSPGGANPGLWHSSPVATVEATVDALGRGFDHWVGGDGPPSCLGTGGDAPFLDRWACNLGREAAVLARGSAALVALAAVGFAAEQRRAVPRVLVPGAFYWGVASILGYPLGTDIMFPGWIAVHAVVPLAIPAAAGLALLARWGAEALADDDTVDAALAAFLVGVVVVGTLATAVQFSFVAPQTGIDGGVTVIQYAQPGTPMRGAIEDVERIAETNEGVDVVVYGSTFVDGSASAPRMPACVRWFAMLPASWYLYRADAEVACADSPENFTALMSSENPPIVISAEVDSNVVDDRIGDGYESSTYLLRLWSRSNRNAEFYVNASARESARLIGY